MNNQSPIVNEFSEIELNDFKNKVKKWLSIDTDIEKLQNKIKELKITKKKNRTRNNIIYG